MIGFPRRQGGKPEGMHLLRTLVGLLFVAHGTQKLFGWFGGDGSERTGEMFEAIGLAPGRRNAMAAGAAETAGGMLMTADLAKPIGAAALNASMLTAIRHVHWAKGPWNQEGGYEYNAVLMAAIFAIVAEDDGVPAALAALAAGAAGSLAASELARSEAERVDEVAPVEHAPVTQPVAPVV